MKVKLNKDEMQALQELLRQSISEYGELKINNLLMVESLLQKIMLEEMWVYFAKKGFEIKKQYVVDFKPRWALAFFFEYNSRFNPASFAGNLVLRLCNSIHKNYIV